MTIRLDTYPAGEQILRGGAPAGPSTPPILSCLLHSGGLPPHQSLSVWVGGLCQQSTDDEGLVVFSWQCGVDVQMEIHLMQEGHLLKAWRGWWKGDTTLAHTGTLTMQVFCAGQLQPAGLGSPPPAPAPSSPLLAAPSEHRNGSTALASVPATGATAVLEWPALAEAPRTLAQPPIQEAPSREGDLWSRAAEPTEEASALEEVEANEVTSGEQEASHAAVVSASPTLAVSAPAGTIVAAARAAQVWSLQEHERVVTDLESVLAGMPEKTILVDLRQHAPTPRTSRAARSRSRTMGLTKELLRTQYGARYWDRGTQLTTSRRMTFGKQSRRSMVVDQPESAEGLGALVIALEQGFSLLLLDGVALYAESSRAAVLAELRQRVANLEIGSCS